MKHSNTVPHRLVFLTVNSSFSHSSLALPLLHSACGELLDWEWIRYDMTINSDIISAVRDIYTYKPDLLVTDLYLFNRQAALEVLLRYHTLAPDCRIAAGGPECSGKGADDLLKDYPWLDCIFRGEGEAIFRDYLAGFDNRTSDAPRIIPPDGNAVFQEWGISPCPAADPFFVTDKPFVQIETSRGCPMKCFYCTSGNTHTRYRTIEQVRQELQLLSQKGVSEIRVLDRTFNLPQERGAELLRMFREEFPQMHFHLELHPQFLNETLRGELQKALPGQLHIEVGVQCLNNRVQHLIGRNSDTDKVLDGLAFLARQSAFETHADLIAGLPGQTWQDILDDTAKLMQLAVDEIQMEILKVLPGTPMREISAGYNILYSPVVPYEVMMSSSMSLEDIQHVRDLSRLLDITYNHRYLHLPVLEMSRTCPDFVSSLLKFFHRNHGDSTVLWDLKKRFLFLLDFCRNYGLQTCQPILAYQWLLAGFPPLQGADEYSQKTNQVPSDAVLCYGTASCVGERETRYCFLPVNDKVYFLAYNRSVALNRPAAVWVAEKNSVQ